jgi:integrase
MDKIILTIIQTMGVYKLHAKTVRGQEDNVYIYLYQQITGKKVPQLISLKIKIPKKHCIPSVRNFKKVSKELPTNHLNRLGFSSVELLNEYLNDELNKFITSNGSRDYTPYDSRTLNDWFEELIKRQRNQGTKMRFQNVYNLLKQFQSWYSENVKKQTPSNIIYLRDIDVSFIYEFQNWLLHEPYKDEVRKRNTMYSTNYKLKCLKAVLNKCHTEEYFKFTNNPFDHIKFSNPDNNPVTLDLDELKKIINTDYVEVYRRTVPTKNGEQLWGTKIEIGIEERNKKNRRYVAKHSLNDIKNYFVFQLLSQGLRVSDMVTLRWSHFEKDGDKTRISKRMVKTQKIINILVNEKMTSIISHYITRYKDFKSSLVNDIEAVNQEINDIVINIQNNDTALIINGCPYSDFIMKYNEEIGLELFHHHNVASLIINSNELYKVERVFRKYQKPTRPSILPFQNKMMDEASSKVFDIKNWLKEQKLIKNKPLEIEYQKLRDRRHLLVQKLILALGKSEFKDEFVFTLLDNQYFLGINGDDFSRLSEVQYRKFQSVRCYYNKLLKIIGQQSGISKNLTSHLSRHSYTSLMLELGENVNLYDLMTSLGHTRLTTTQTYIQKLTNKRTDNLNLVISEKLNTGITLKL